MNKFFAAVMGKTIYPSKLVRDEQGNIHHTDYTWSPSLNGEISYEVRKWFQEYEPDVWKTYLEKTMYDLKMWPDILNAQLSIQNFYDYLVANWQEWGYEECPYCDGGDIRLHLKHLPPTTPCVRCNGTGCICKYPEAEKIIKGEK